MRNKHRKREQKKKLKKNKSKIVGLEIMLNSSDKLGRHLDNVRSGTGAHKSLKDYKRKGKWGKSWEK